MKSSKSHNGFGSCEPASICPHKKKEVVCEPASICPYKVGGGSAKKREIRGSQLHFSVKEFNLKEPWGQALILKYLDRKR
jgi:hypothetical protein